MVHLACLVAIGTFIVVRNASKQWLVDWNVQECRRLNDIHRDSLPTASRWVAHGYQCKQLV